jgi:hypothetical protein
VGNLVGRPVKNNDSNPGITADGISCAYTDMEPVIKFPGGGQTVSFNISAATVTWDTTGIHSDSHRETLTTAERDVQKRCPTCAVHETSTFGTGAFEAYGIGEILYPGVKTGECELWIRDGGNRPLDIDVQVNRMAGSTSDMSQGTTCNWVEGMAQLLMK